MTTTPLRSPAISYAGFDMRVIAPKSNIPPGNSLYSLTRHTVQAPDKDIGLEHLYVAFRTFVPTQQRINTIDANQFTEHLKRRCATTGLSVTSDPRQRGGAARVNAAAAFDTRAMT